ncbi:hypothetical protein D3C87_1686040 [compost metagenome]
MHEAAGPQPLFTVYVTGCTPSPATDGSKIPVALFTPVPVYIPPASGSADEGGSAVTVRFFAPVNVKALSRTEIVVSFGQETAGAPSTAIKPGNGPEVHP